MFIQRLVQKLFIAIFFCDNPKLDTPKCLLTGEWVSEVYIRTQWQTKKNQLRKTTNKSRNDYTEQKELDPNKINKKQNASNPISFLKNKH